MTRTFSALVFGVLLLSVGCSSGRREPRRRVDGGTVQPPIAPREPAARRSSVRTKEWAAASGGRAPLVVLLHGAGGPGFFIDRPEYRRYPEALAAAGFRVVMPYYAESHDTPARTVRVLLDDLDVPRVGVIGFSRGGFIGSCVSGIDPRVVAFVSFYGGLDDGCRERITRMPPTLAMHGEADGLVPLEESKRLIQFVQSQRAPSALKLYPGQEHVFLGDALEDSVRRAVEFLGRHLAGRPANQ